MRNKGTPDAVLVRGGLSRWNKQRSYEGLTLERDFKRRLKRVEI